MQFTYIGNQGNKDVRLAGSTANGAFVTANAASVTANAAYLTANSAFDKANNALPLTGGTVTGNLTVNGTFIVSGNGANAITFADGTMQYTANAGSTTDTWARGQANSAYITANAAYAAANALSSSSDPWVRTQANNAYDKANSAGVFANSSFTTANNALPKAGGTVTGNITLSSTASMIIQNTQATISNSTGALIVDGGLAVKGNTWISGVFTVDGDFSVGNQTSTGNVLHSGFVTFTQPTEFTSNAASTSNSTGGIIVYGGAGIRGNVYTGAIRVTGSTANGITFADGTTQYTANGGASATDSWVRIQANNAYDKANSGAAFANAAFTTANAALPKSGGTVTGNVTLSTTASMIIQNTQPTVSNSTGALIVDGGLAVKGNTWISGVFTVDGDFQVGNQTTSGNVINNGLVTFTQPTNFTNVASATSNTTGAVIVTGGVGIKGNVYTGAITVTGSTANGITFADGTTQYTANTDPWARTRANNAYDTANGAFTTANLKFNSSGGTISGDVNITGNLSITGNTFSTSATQIVANDTLFIMGTGNYSGDVLDIGFAAHYNNGTNAHTGLIRDSGTKEWQLFEEYTPEVGANNNIIITDSSFKIATLNANLKSTTITIKNIDLLPYVNNAYNTANSGASFANGAFGVANSAASFANGSFDRANAAFAAANLSSGTYASSAYNQANSAASFANGAFVTANSAASFANGSFVTANSAASFANGAFTTANSAAVFANASFLTANSGANFANAAFVTANVSYASQNTTAGFANAAFDRANAAYNAANTGGSSTDSWARAQANAAFNAANTGGGGGGTLTGYVDSFTANGAIDNFTLSTTPSNKNITFVSVQGVLQPKASYNIAGSILTFDSTPPNTAFIEVTTLVGAGGSGGSSMTWYISNANTTMVASSGYFVDTTNGPVTMTLPTTGTLGDTIRINDLAGTFSANNLTINRNSHKIQGNTNDLLVNVDQSSFGLIYSNSTYGWKVIEL